MKKHSGIRYNKRRGIDRERRVMEQLWSMGALDINRSYASKGLIDVRVTFPSHHRMIQVKKNYISKGELVDLQRLADQVTADNIFVELWWYPKRRLEVKRLNSKPSDTVKYPLIPYRHV